MDSTLKDLIDQVCRLVSEQGREFWWITREVSEAFERQGYHLLPRHFYSPVPDPETIARHDWHRHSFPLSRLGFEEASAFEWCRRFAVHAREIESLPSAPVPGGGYHWGNTFFTGLDAVALYGMVREVRPRRIIEVGSGFSTRVSLSALGANGSGRVTCIEPYPTAALREVAERVELLQMPVQQAPIEMFESLAANDILFIDSSHVSALDSDVNREILELLPAIAPGVYVHVHDIFFPWDYPAFFVDQRRWFWNEQYLLYAFLLLNPAFEVIFPVQNLLWRQWPEVSSILGPYAHPLRSGTSFWLRRAV